MIARRPARNLLSTIFVILSLFQQVIIPVGGKEYPPAEPPMRQDFKESVKWFDDDDDDTLVDYEELDAITEADATLKRLAGKNNYTGLTLAEIDKHAKTVRIMVSL